MALGQVRKMSGEDKKEFIRGCLQGQIFTSSMVPDSEWVRMVPQIFLPIAFGCLEVLPDGPPPPPQEIEEDMSVEEFDRLHETHQAAVDNWTAVKAKLQKDFDDSLGIVWEWYDKSLPRGINGYPMFMSCRLMSREDWEEVLPILQEKQRQLDDIDL